MATNFKTTFMYIPTTPTGERSCRSRLAQAVELLIRGEVRWRRVFPAAGSTSFPPSPGRYASCYADNAAQEACDRDWMSRGSGQATRSIRSTWRNPRRWPEQSRGLGIACRKDPTPFDTAPTIKGGLMRAPFRHARKSSRAIGNRENQSGYRMGMDAGMTSFGAASSPRSRMSALRALRERKARGSRISGRSGPIGGVGRTLGMMSKPLTPFKPASASSPGLEVLEGSE